MDDMTVPVAVHRLDPGLPLPGYAHPGDAGADWAAKALIRKKARELFTIDATYFDTSFEPPHFDEQPNERAAFRAPVPAYAAPAGRSRRP